MVAADSDTTRIRVKPTALDDNLVGDEAGKLIEVKLEDFDYIQTTRKIRTWTDN